MSDIKVSEMAEATTLNDNDLLMVVQNGTNKKVKANKIRKSGVILFENEEGLNDNITLTDSLANYKEYEVEYMLSTSADGNIYQSTGRISSNHLKFILTIWRPTSTQLVQFITELFSVNSTNNTITFVTSENYNLGNTVWTNRGTGLKELKIVKVIGYK